MNKKKISKEYIHPNEEYFTSDIIKVITKSLKKDYAPGKYYRRFHAKSIALLEADFEVEKNLPEELSVGLFKTQKTYKAWVRFSNAAQKISADSKAGVRGISIKVLDVGETPLEYDELGQTQDILLTNNSIIFPGTVEKQHYAIRTLFFCRLYFFLTLNLFRLKSLFVFLKGRIKMSDFFNEKYFSATPYLFGDGQAIKWHARPAVAIKSIVPSHPSRDFLRQKIVEDLSKMNFSFELLVQMQKDPYREPIEDASVEWSTPFKKVATIILLHQDINTPERKKLEEAIKFNPWHSMPSHRPLGGINRLRRKIYSQLSMFRQQHNLGLITQESLQMKANSIITK